MKIAKIILLLMSFLLLGSCSESEGIARDFFLYANYTNSTGSNPQLEILPELSSSEIFFDGIIESSVIQQSILLTMNNLSIYSQEQNFYIDAIKVEEDISGEWVWFPEFNVNYLNLTQLGVILVLDVSSSLGDDFNSVMDYAAEFVELVLENASESQIGIVSFSTEVDVFPPTTLYYELENYIYGLEMGEYTRMYDAMSAGIDLLEALNVDGKALVTFTDGWDNLSETTPADLVADLNELGIRSYTMGLQGKGGVNVAVLEDLAVNGNYRLTSSKKDLRNIFQFFAQSVSNVYRVIYQRNGQIITNPRLIRYTFTDEE